MIAATIFMHFAPKMAQNVRTNFNLHLHQAELVQM